jgi:drug/metabolite transporter (DMT)-like permease
MNRRNWARILTLILGGFGAIAGLIFLFIAGALWFVPTPGPDAGIMILAYLLYLFLGLLFTGYCLWTYLILLNARYSAEFR